MNDARTQAATVVDAADRDGEIFRKRAEAMADHSGRASADAAIRADLGLSDDFDIDAAVERHCQAAFTPGARLTRFQSAAYLGISVSRLYQQRTAGLINQQKNLVTGEVRYVFGDLVQLKRYRDQAIHTGV